MSDKFFEADGTSSRREVEARFDEFSRIRRAKDNMTNKKAKPARIEIDPAIVADLARQFAEERLAGLPGGRAWFREFKARGEKVARRHGLPWIDLYAEIHKAAYEIIDRRTPP